MKSYVNRRLIAELCEDQELITDILSRLPGYVEEIGEQIVARHDAIAELVIENIFALDNNGLVLLANEAIKKAAAMGELDIIQRMIPLKTLINESGFSYLLSLLDAKCQLSNPKVTLD